jgi:hypothetical protein
MLHGMWSRPRIVRWTALWAFFLVALQLPLAWAATDEERAAARNLASQGARAFQSKDYPSSVDLFGRAEALIHSPVHLLFLARSHRALGELVKAREAYIKITRERLEPGAPKVFFDAQRDAGAELEEIEPRLASLTVTIAGVEPEEARLTLDGETVPAVLVGVPMPVDPGTHEVVAGAVGAEDQSQSVTLAEGQKETLGFELVVTKPLDAEEEGRPADKPPEGVTKEPRSKALKVIGWTAVALGAGGGGYAGFLALEAFGLEDQIDREANACAAREDGCPDPTQLEFRQRDKRVAARKTDAAILGGVSAGVLALGIVFLAVDGASDDSAGLTPWIGWQSAGLSGTF